MVLSFSIVACGAAEAGDEAPTGSVEDAVFGSPPATGSGCTDMFTSCVTATCSDELARVNSYWTTYRNCVRTYGTGAQTCATYLASYTSELSKYNACVDACDRAYCH